MKRAYKFGIFIFIFALVISLCFGVFFKIFYEKFLVEDMKNDLNYAIKSSSSQVDLFLDVKKQRVIDFASDGFIKNKLYELRNYTSQKLMDELNSHLINNKIVVDNSLYEVFVLDVNGVVVGSTEESFLLKDMSLDSLFLNGQKETYVKDIFYDEGFLRYGIAVSSPVYRNREFVGVVVIRVIGEELGSAVLSSFELERPIDIYIVDSNFSMMSKSLYLRNENRGIFVQNIETENSKRCFSSNFTSEILPNNFLDFKGDLVVGGNSKISNANLCVLVELNREMAVDVHLNRFFTYFSIFVLALISIFVVVGIFLRKFLRIWFSFTYPINEILFASTSSNAKGFYRFCLPK